MPKISEFYGIIISMNYSDHAPPHFHVRYAGRKATMAIRSGEILKGELPARAFRLVHEWWELRQGELEENWARYEDGLSLLPIAPL